MKHRGFTLIELLIVVAIIGILAAIAVPNFLNAQIRAKVAKAQADMNALGSAVQMYQIDRNVYPCDGQEVNCIWAWAWQNWRLTTPIAYISSIPKDPFAFLTSSGHYWYTTREGYGGVRAPGRATSVKGRNNVRLYDPPRTKFRFAYISAAPDKFWEWDRPASADPKYTTQYVGDVLYYNPSNGTLSIGDMYLYGPGNALNPPGNFD